MELAVEETRDGVVGAAIRRRSHMKFVATHLINVVPVKPDDRVRQSDVLCDTKDLAPDPKNWSFGIEEASQSTTHISHVLNNVEVTYVSYDREPPGQTSISQTQKDFNSAQGSVARFFAHSVRYS